LQEVPVPCTRTYNRTFQVVLARKGRLKDAPDKTRWAGPAICCGSGLVLSRPGASPTGLLEFNLGASCFQLGFDVFGFGFGHAFLDGFAARVDQVFGILEAQAGNGTHFFDDADFLVTR
jgi:hypothetical protein